ncbi:MAG TPA: three-Cys-motif partner protein TcmP [bacterium]|nr:three-Cys-motif partner protein TcmP [bacterium]HQJ66434.1 three-Cys-motif partner protein TcmP [bacterium]
MPVENGVGQSAYTETKQEHLRTILRTHINIVKSILKKRSYSLPCYYYYDINAGPGIYNNGEIGSPLVFVQEAERARINYQAVFIEIKDDSYNRLLSLFGDNPHVKIYHGDNQEILPLLIPNTKDRQWRYGMIYTDPNGIFNDKAIADFVNRECFSATDVLINCPASAIKRSINCCKCKDDRRLEDRLRQINKKYWIVKDPQNSRWQWTHIMLTNWPNHPEFSQINMYRHNSQAGKAIFAKLNNTNKELASLTNYGLFEQGWATYNDYLKSDEFSQVRKAVFARSKGMCDICKNNQATEPHHIAYSHWYAGEVDALENLVAVCHQCHCRIHGKEK